MEIDINQKKISIGDKYKIFIDGRESYFASRRLFRLLPQVDLYETNNEANPRMTINKRWSFFKAKYDIIRRDIAVFHFRTISYWKRHYTCQCGKDLYDIYGHRGRKFSIYKNGNQVAWWDKNAVTWFAGDNYKIFANRDCDVDLLISFCLIIDNFAHDKHDKSTVTMDVGNIGPQSKKFDPNWTPK